MGCVCHDPRVSGHVCHHPRTTAAGPRWVLFHLIEETARHNGHLDILRELADGARGR